MADVDNPTRQPNRHERRAQETHDRKSRKKLKQRIEAAARRRFERIRKMQAVIAETAASDYTFG